MTVLSRIQNHLANFPNANLLIEKTLNAQFHSSNDTHNNDGMMIYEADDGRKYIKKCDENIYIELYDDDAKKYGGKRIYKLLSSVVPVSGSEMRFEDAINDNSITITNSITRKNNSYLACFWSPSKCNVEYTKFVAVSNDNVAFPWGEVDGVPHIPDNNNTRFVLGALTYEISIRKDDPNKPFCRSNWNDTIIETDVSLLLDKMNKDIKKVFCRYSDPPI